MYVYAFLVLTSHIRFSSDEHFCSVKTASLNFENYGNMIGPTAVIDTQYLYLTLSLSEAPDKRNLCRVIGTLPG